eukprot:TRINITY_DN7453_c0_g1_i1.p1 TRINITY_DN7453_c0_g1~~TRINITY_DN7453_c0_g1_i1.p1  ORF type:complete len:217 (+),score=109.89 TRINITY_DN7453_c0_g1_i1:154-804(+)
MGLLDAAVDRLRKVKFRMEKAVENKAKDLLFEDHRVLTEEELNIDNEFDIDKTEAYLRQAEEKKKVSSRAEVDDNRIMKMVRQREIITDVAEPFVDRIEQHKSIRDTEVAYEQKAMEESSREKRKKVKQLTEALGGGTDFISGLGSSALDDELMTAGSANKGEGSEKRKLADFIRKKATEKKTGTDKEKKKEPEKEKEKEKEKDKGILMGNKKKKK